MRFEATPLACGRAGGAPLVLDDPLSFWGGVDASTGVIIDVHHPQIGARLAGRTLVMPTGRGSSSSSSVLAELIRHRAGPAAIVLARPDPIIAIGSFVAAELYGITIPVVSVAPDAYRACVSARHVKVEVDNVHAAIMTSE